MLHVQGSLLQLQQEAQHLAEALPSTAPATLDARSRREQDETTLLLQLEQRAQLVAQLGARLEAERQLHGQETQQLKRRESQAAAAAAALAGEKADLEWQLTVRLKENAELRAQIERLRRALADEAQRTAARDASSSSQRRRALDDVREELLRERTRRATAERSADQHKADCARAQAEAVRLREQLANSSSTDEIRSRGGEGPEGDGDSASAELRRQLEDAQAEAAETQALLDAMQSTYEKDKQSWRERLAQLEAQLQQQQQQQQESHGSSRSTAAAAELERARAEAAEAHALLDAMQTTYEQDKQGWHERLERLEQRRAEAERLAAANQELQAALTASSRQLEAASAQLVALKAKGAQDAAALRQAQEGLEQLLGSHQDTIAAMQARLESADSGEVQHEHELRDLQAEVAAARRAQADAADDIAARDARIAELEQGIRAYTDKGVDANANAGVEADLRQTLAQHEATIAALQQRVGAADAEEHQREQELSRLQEALATAQSASTAAAATTAAADKRELAARDARIAELEGQLHQQQAAAAAQAPALREILAQHEATIAALQRRVEAADQAALADDDRDVGQASEDVLQLQLRLQDLEADIAARDSELARLAAVAETARAAPSAAAPPAPPAASAAAVGDSKRVAVLEEQLEHITSQALRAQQASAALLDEHQATIAHMEQRLLAAEAGDEQLRTALQQTQAQLSGALQALQEANVDIQQRDHAIGQWQLACERLQGQVSILSGAPSPASSPERPVHGGGGGGGGGAGSPVKDI